MGLISRKKLSETTNDFWELPENERALIDQIVVRAFEMDLMGGVDIKSHTMDLIACHKHCQKLDLEQFLAFDDGSFGHDFYGIARFLNRETICLDGCFLARCAADDIGGAAL